MKQYLVKGLSTILIIGVIIWLVFAGENYISQPIDFNHKLHIQDVGLECADCHLYYEQLASAGIPNIAECSACHSEKNGESPHEALVVEYIQQKRLIPWKQVNQIPEHVYFSHARHFKIGRIECARCHGPMENLEKPLSKPFIALEMNWCIKCHDTQGVSNDCLRCHK